MTRSSDVERHRRALRAALAEEKASGLPADTAWTDNLPDDELPSEDLETSVTFIQKAQRPPYGDVLKWDRNQPRGPKGTREGGRWVKDVSMATGNADPTVLTGGSRTVGSKLRAQLEQRRQRVLGDGGATYGDIMRAPMGTGFGNAPRLTGDPAIVDQMNTTMRMPPPRVDTPLLKTFQEASVSDHDELDPGGHANAAFKVTLDDDNRTEAVLKPESGERWKAAFSNSDISHYLTNRDFSLAEREAIAYEISTALGLGLVPETVLRKEIGGIDLSEVGGGDDGGNGGYSRTQLQQMYDSYREKAQEDAMDGVGEEMQNLWGSYAKNAEGAADSVREIWDKMVEDDPDQRIAAAQASRQHPTFPMGSRPDFERTEPEEIDIHQVMQEARVDFDNGAGLNDTEEERVREILSKKFEEGAEVLSDFDRDKFQEDEYDDWLSNHSDTEMRLLEERIQSFDAWRNDNGFESAGGSGSTLNPEAPHPNGGMLQKWVEGLHNYSNATPEEIRKLAVFDYLQGTMDRHGGNVFFDGDGRLLAMDNGYSMPDPPDPSGKPDGFTFRSDAIRNWLKYGNNDQSMPTEERERLSGAMESTDWDALADRHPSMSSGEREAFLGRVERMKEALKTEKGLYSLWRRQLVMG